MVPDVDTLTLKSEFYLTNVYGLLRMKRRVITLVKSLRIWSILTWSTSLKFMDVIERVTPLESWKSLSSHIFVKPNQDHFVITTVGILASSPSLLHSSAPYDIKASLIGGDMPKPGQNKQLFWINNYKMMKKNLT